MKQKRAFNTEQAAEYCSLSRSYLQKARMTAAGARVIDAPAHTRISAKKIVYLIEDLDAWLESHRAKTVEAAA